MPYSSKEKKKEYQKKYYQKYKFQIIEKNRQYREENIDEIRRKGREYHQKHQNERNAKRKIDWKKYYLENKDKEKERKILYYQENKEKEAIRGKKYRIKNVDKTKERHKNWYQLNKKEINRKAMIRRKSTTSKKIRFNISALIREKLKRRLLNKNGKSTFSFLPYTIDDLIKHLELKFKQGMSWGNYGRGNGKWNIDHEKPDCLFDYESVEDEEFQKCWSLDNLQPLWAEENFKKNRFFI